MRIYVDMDGVLCDIAAGYERIWRESPETRYPQSVPGLFAGLDPLPGAIEVVNRLRAEPAIDLWIASRPSVRNPHSYSEKRLWIEQHFDFDLAKRLILITNKSLLRGEILVDDNATGAGQDRFEGALVLHRGDWAATESAIARLARVWAIVMDVYGYEDDARRFLTTPHTMLRERSPLSVAGSDDGGAAAVEGILGRLKHGTAP